MVTRIRTVAFQGIEAETVEVQVQISPGLPAFMIVGLPDKAVAESRERVRSSFLALGLDIPPKRVTVNLAPADLQKEGSHYDLPIALGLMGALGVIRQEDVDPYIVLGELGLDGSIAAVAGVLPTAVEAALEGKGIICPKGCSAEACWAGDLVILAPPHLLSLVNHFRGTQVLSPPEPDLGEEPSSFSHDLKDVKGQPIAKRALEICAAGGHNLLLRGPPGAGKSMLASRLQSILPALSAQEALEVTMIHSLAGCLPQGGLVRQRPFRDPHHSASLPALIGGGHKCRPGEVSLAHHGVLFLDELPEFQRATLEALRQPLESGRAVVARVNSHVSFPACIQLVAAMNPCRCGYFGDVSRSCHRSPRCAQEYQNRISGPLLDRFDMIVDVVELPAAQLLGNLEGESSKGVAARVLQARKHQEERYKNNSHMLQWINARAEGKDLEQAVILDAQAKQLLGEALKKFNLSGRGYHRILKVARTIADLADKNHVEAIHIAEALSFRQF
jgi:magnesium chelatase family protein